MDLRKVRKLIEIFHSSELTELKIREGEESIYLSRRTEESQRAVMPHSDAVGPVQHLPGDTMQQSDSAPEPLQDEPPEENLVRSPMVGTFYRSSSPQEPAYVEVGDRVEAGQTICLIEAMKIFNQIESDRAGTVTRISRENGEPVEYGEILFVIE